LARLDHEEAARLVERDPVVEERRRPERPVGVVVRDLLLGRAGVDDDGVVAGLAKRLRVDLVLVRDVAGVESFDVGEVHDHTLAGSAQAAMRRATPRPAPADVATALSRAGTSAGAMGYRATVEPSAGTATSAG